MPTSTASVTFLIILAVVLVVTIWWFVVAEKYKRYLDNYEYARGANASKAGDTLNLTCDQDKEICVYRAVQVCSQPDSNNFENSATDPIAGGIKSDGKVSTSYGDYNPNTTVNATPLLVKECNGQEKCAYKFTPVQFPGTMTCPAEHTQLISTYSCIPKGAVCQSYKPKSN